MRTLLISLLSMLTFLPTANAQQFRPFCGSGVLIIRPLNPETPVAPLIPFYRDPGVARIDDRPAAKIPGLSSILRMPDGEYPLAVMGKKGNWLRIAYDDAGRDGWVERARWWDYITWEEFLKGRIARLLAGLKKESYTLRSEPLPTAPQTGVLSAKEELRIVEVKDVWALAITGSGLIGWFTWQDGDGRFLITLNKSP